MVLCYKNVVMDKKDIYEHLAKIYLDASSNKKNKEKTYPRALNKVYILVIFFVFVVSVGLFITFKKHNRPNSEVALVLLSESAKLNFHFEPAKKETYSFNLNKLNLLTYKKLAFTAKRVNYTNSVSLRVEFDTPFKERGEVYVKDIPNKWQDYKINISDFKGIGDWSEMSGLTFTVEEWNSKEKKGVVYIDNVRLLK